MQVLLLPPSADGGLAMASSTCVREAIAQRDRPLIVQMCGEAVAEALLLLPK